MSRASEERNIPTLHRAGANFVMSYKSLGTNAIFNFLIKRESLLLDEGPNVFHCKTTESLVDKTPTQSGIREKTGCTVIAIQHNGATSINPEPAMHIGRDDELILIGTYDAETDFLNTYAA